jgi:hypothetical protein
VLSWLPRLGIEAPEQRAAVEAGQRA